MLQLVVHHGGTVYLFRQEHPVEKTIQIRKSGHAKEDVTRIGIAVNNAIYNREKGVTKTRVRRVEHWFGS